YECLTGRPPFKAAAPLETVLQVISEVPVPARRLQPGGPRDLEIICHKCLEKEPRKRYASAGELADDLHRFLNNEPIGARPVGAAGRVLRWARRRPAVAALVGVSAAAALALLLAGLWFTVRLRQERDVAREAREEAVGQHRRALEREADAERASG